MKSVVAYVRNLLGWCDDDPAIRTSFKRDRTDDDVLCDEAPALKRLKQLRSTNFPNIMSSNDAWEKKEKNVRYVPIQVESGHPSTSTPLEVNRSGGRGRTVPLKLVDVTGHEPATPLRKPRMHTPLRPVMHHVVDDDDDDDEEEVTWVESKPGKSKKPEVYIDLEDDDHDPEETENDVIFVKKVSDPQGKPFKFFVTKNDRKEPTKDVPYYRINRKLNDRHSLSPRSYTKFKAPAGIMKTYKKTAIPKWMQPQKPCAFPRSRLLDTNGSNIRSTLSEVFNLDEKRNYQELIRRVAGTTKPVSFSKPIDIVNIADDSASFRNTQRAQRKSLNEIRLVEKGLLAEREGEASKEYDPITVASINSSDSEVEVVPSESSTSSSVRINPINSLKDSYRDKDITSTDWLAKIDSKYRKKRQETQEKLKDARRESDIISKVNYEQKLAHLEHKLKYELSIPESLIEEPQPTVELPELTPEQEKLINRAIGPGPSGQLIIEKFNLRIHRRDLQTLSGLNWLNDEVINFYMNLIMQRCEERQDLPKTYAANTFFYPKLMQSGQAGLRRWTRKVRYALLIMQRCEERQDLPKTYAANTFFYPKLMQSGQAGLRRWTRKVDIFAHDLMVVPVHLGVHWCMSMVDFRAKRIQYLDSMGGKNQPCLNALLQYLKDEHQDKKGQPFDDSGWKLECLSKDIPQQMNGSDCGMFSCTFAEFSARNAPYSFSQQHMPYLRRKAALEIITGRLLL